MKRLKQIFLAGLISLLSFNASASLEIIGYKAITKDGREVNLADAQSVSDAITELKRLIDVYHPTNIIPEKVYHSIDWMLDENTPWMVSQVQEGENITLPNTPYKAGYSFIGWEPSVPVKMPAYDLTEVAQWEESGSDIDPRSYGYYFDSYPRVISRYAVFQHSSESLKTEFYYLINPSYAPLYLFSIYDFQESDNINLTNVWARDCLENISFEEFKFKPKRIDSSGNVLRDEYWIFELKPLATNLNLTTNDIICVKKIHNKKYNDQFLSYYYELLINDDYRGDIYLVSHTETTNDDGKSVVKQILDGNTFSYEVNDKEINASVWSGTESSIEFISWKPVIAANRRSKNWHPSIANLSPIRDKTYYLFDKTDSIITNQKDLLGFTSIICYNHKRYSQNDFINAQTYPTLYEFSEITISPDGGTDPIMQSDLVYVKDDYNFNFGTINIPTNRSYSIYMDLAGVGGANFKNYNSYLGIHYSSSINLFGELNLNSITITNINPINEASISIPQYPFNYTTNFDYSAWIKNQNSKFRFSVASSKKLNTNINIEKQVEFLTIYNHLNSTLYNPHAPNSCDFVFENRRKAEVQSMDGYPFGANIGTKFICSDGILEVDDISHFSQTLDNGIHYEYNNGVLTISGSNTYTGSENLYAWNILYSNAIQINSIIFDENCSLQYLGLHISNFKGKYFKYPDSIKIIDYNFSSNDGNELKYVEVNSGCESIKSLSYRKSSEDQYIYIPKSVTSLGYLAFGNTRINSNIYFEGTEQEWNNIEYNGSGDYERSEWLPYTNIIFNATTEQFRNLINE